MKDKMPHIDKNAIAKFLSGEANATEINSLLDWVVLCDENRDRFAQYERVWSASQLSTRKSFNANTAWAKVSRRIINKQRNLRILYSGIAAAVIGVIVIIAQFVNTGNQSIAPQLTMLSHKEPVNTVLPDGSAVILSEHSKIGYMFDSLRHTRLAELSGKAFFDVKHDTTQRFVVKTNYGGVEVLGTQFAVGVLENTDVQVDVLSGKVKLFLPQISGDTLFLIITNNETAIISMQNDTITKQQQEASAFYTINKTITFSNIDLPTIVSELKKCYSTNIEIDSTVNKSLRFSSSFKEKSLDEILTVITQTLELDYSKNDDVFYITNSNNEE
jgi:ferric-dicitrate binding protein FerR (iron transport regulator)